jgi:oligopeptide/dipeptide ABC transporter ATP-binding protein
MPGGRADPATRDAEPGRLRGARAPGFARRRPGSDVTAPRIAAEDLTVLLPAGGRMRAAVRDVSFSIADGEALAVVGESGCGKTQLALALLGLSPDGARVEGRVRLAGREISSLSDRDWSQVRGHEIGIVFQEPASALDPVRTIGDHLDEALALHGARDAKERRRVGLEALRAVAFPDPESGWDAYPHRLSGGLRQRACLAIALAPGPRVLLADEPTASLDATVARQILEVIDRLRKELGLAVLLITHDLGLVARHCDRVLVLYAGQVVEESPVGDLFRDPGHPYTRGLLRAAPRLVRDARRTGERYATISGVVGELSGRPETGCGFERRCPERFEPCAVRGPELYARGKSRVRCFLHEPGARA